MTEADRRERLTRWLMEELALRILAGESKGNVRFVLDNLRIGDADAKNVFRSTRYAEEWAHTYLGYPLDVTTVTERRISETR